MQLRLQISKPLPHIDPTCCWCLEKSNKLQFNNIYFKEFGCWKKAHGLMHLFNYAYIIAVLQSWHIVRLPLRAGPDCHTCRHVNWKWRKCGVQNHKNTVNHAETAVFSIPAHIASLWHLEQAHVSSYQLRFLSVRWVGKVTSNNFSML